MKAAILCPGPSLSITFRRRGDYELLVAVNRAAHHWPCDWWVALDSPSFKTLPPWIPPKWLTTQAAKAESVIPDGVEVHDTETWYTDVQPDLGGACWATFSMTAAMIVALRQGATSIDLYGYDATDADDFDGTRHPTSNRTAGRWAHEALCFDVVSKWLADRGCLVNRIRP